jgi:ubiquitin-conjugating enzyme E2 A
MSFAINRLTKELHKLKNEPVEGFVLTDTENMMCWKGILNGPNDTPYQEGKFKIQFTFDEDYPKCPPSVKFLQPIFHPNIYRDGKICVDILQSHEWSPVQTVRSIVLSLQSLFMDPNPASPANRDAAQLLMKSKDEYNTKVKEEIQKYT